LVREAGNIQNALCAAGNIGYREVDRDWTLRRGLVARRITRTRSLMASVNTNSNPVLGIFAVAALLAFLAVENSKLDVKQKWYNEKLEAAKQAKTAQQAIKDYRFERGVFMDEVNDPNETALIGQDLTPITTDRGDIDAKLASTNPNFAAVVVELLKQAGVREKDHVAVAMTGSFPALNISVLSALETLKLVPIVITSVGASNWGANDPQFTWLDMERLLERKKIYHTRSVAASIGGGGDVGRGLSPEGRGMIIEAIKRNNVDLINLEHIEKSIDRRIELYEKHSRGRPIKAYINIGGGIASLGTVVNGEIIPSGLSKQLPVKNYPVRGVIIEMAKRGIPIIHLYNIRQMWRDYELPIDPIPLPEPGSGGIFVRVKYDMWISWIAVGVLSGMILIAGYIDRRKHRLGTEPVPVLKAELGHEL
jgi:poly-gamma-glutamate system protein